MSHFVYFNDDKQSFQFIQGAGSLYFDKEKFSVRRNNIEQIVEEGNGEIINEEITIYKPTITEGVTYKVTGYIQFEIDIYTYNTVDWIVFIYNGSNKYIHKVNYILLHRGLSKFFRPRGHKLPKGPIPKVRARGHIYVS